jgi:hypothetical protein
MSNTSICNVSHLSLVVTHRVFTFMLVVRRLVGKKVPVDVLGLIVTNI